MRNLFLTLILIFNLGLIFFGLKNIVHADAMRVKITSLFTDLGKTKTELALEKKMSQQYVKELKDIKVVKQQVEEELKEKKEEASELAQKLATEKRKRRQLERKLRNAEKQVKQLKLQVKKEKEKSSELEKRLERMAGRLERDQDDKAKLLSKLNNVEKERDTLKSEITQMDRSEKKYSLAEITISEQKKYNGMVLNYNEKFNFVIISIGKNEGLVPGVTLVVHRGQKLLGKVEVEKVFEKMSSAKVLSITDGETIQTDDRVRKF